MDTEAKHGMPKVVALADKLARLVLDQVEKDGCVNLVNIRNAMMGPLAHDEMDQQDYQMRLAEKHAKAREQWEAASQPREGVKGPEGNVGPIGPAGSGQIQLWAHRPGPNGPQGRRIVAATRPLLKALGDAIASGQAQRVSISDGTYVLPGGEVLTEREMIMRSGTDGRGS